MWSRCITSIFFARPWVVNPAWQRAVLCSKDYFLNTTTLTKRFSEKWLALITLYQHFMIGKFAVDDVWMMYVWKASALIEQCGFNTSVYILNRQSKVGPKWLHVLWHCGQIRFPKSIASLRKVEKNTLTLTNRRHLFFLLWWLASIFYILNLPHIGILCHKKY